MTRLIEQAEFKAWIERSLSRQEHILAVSNQGTVLRYQQGDHDVIVKTAMGSGLVRKARQRTLLREYQAYQRMDGLAGVPHCHGMIDGRYLVVDFIRGSDYRKAQWADRDSWFKSFLELLQAMHERGVAHGDLKSKDNILVTPDEKPCVIDFGTAFVFREGLHPVNNWMFRHARRMDINAWVKHKYHGRYQDVTGTDLELLDYSRLEVWARKYNRRPTGQIPRK